MAVLDLATIITPLKYNFCTYILLLVLFYISMLTFYHFIYLYIHVICISYLFFIFCLGTFLCLLSFNFSLIWSFHLYMSIIMCMCESDHRWRPPHGA